MFLIIDHFQHIQNSFCITSSVISVSLIILLCFKLTVHLSKLTLLMSVAQTPILFIFTMSQIFLVTACSLRFYERQTLTLAYMDIALTIAV